MIEKLKQFLTNYAAEHRSGQFEIDRNIDLKSAHSLRVLAEAAEIADAERFPEPVAKLVHYAALFHDLSRFAQFRDYRTFNDQVSYDHGTRSAELVRELEPLAFLSKDELDDVCTAIELHNKAELPPELSGRSLLLCRTVRDADKIDIMTIILRELDNPAVVLNLGDLSCPPSPKVIGMLKAEKPIRHLELRTAADFLASKFQWGRELSFRRSREIFLERGYLDQLRSKLPPSAALDEIHRTIQEKLKS